MSNATDHRAFEVAYFAALEKGDYYTFERDAAGLYIDPSARFAWRLWCHARSFYTHTSDPPNAAGADTPYLVSR